MWLPELLGLGDDEVQTTVNFCHQTADTITNYKHSSPGLGTRGAIGRAQDQGSDAGEHEVDERGGEAARPPGRSPLSLCHYLFQLHERKFSLRHCHQFQQSQGEAEQLKRELTRARSKLEEEKTIRGNIQADLEQYQERVRVCMESMDSVEREFEARDLALARLEGEKERGGEVQVGQMHLWRLFITPCSGEVA